MKILISTEEALERELYYLPDMFDYGLECFHLRKPNWSLSQTKAFLENIPLLYHSKIVLHNHYSLCKEFLLKGIHIPSYKREDFLSEEAFNLVNIKTISTSFHSLKEVEDCAYVFDYAFLSPVFDSISKQNYTAKKFDIKAFKTEIPLVALGGVNFENLHELASKGFENYALLGAVWLENNPLKALIPYLQNEKIHR